MIYNVHCFSVPTQYSDMETENLKALYNQLEDDKNIRESGRVADELFSRGIDVMALASASKTYSSFRF